MASPLVTVLVTTYNYGKFIEQAVDSVLAQEYPLGQVQILVVDDGSTDDTAERLRKYGSRIEYLYKPNGGQASALNFGFAQARGEVVALLDADDLFLPSKLTRIANAFQQDPSLGMVYHRTREWQPESNQYREYEFLAVSGDLHKQPDPFVYYIPQPTTCVSFRRTSVAPLFPIPENIRMNADCFLVALIPFLAPILALDEPLSLYRLHGQNSYSREDRNVPRDVHQKRLLIWQTVIAEMRGWLASHGYTNAFRPVQAFLDRWDILIENETFAISHPDRVRYYRHLIMSSRYRRPLMSWRLALINYLDAFAALLVGYDRLPRWQSLRESLIRRLRALLGKHALADNTK